MKLAGALCLVGGAGLVACTALTHAYDWTVGGSSTPAGAQSLCAFCPGHPQLRHAPCPSSGAASGENTLVFAVKSVDVGSDKTEWYANNPFYTSGLDLDCSLREPSGAPVWCSGSPGATWHGPLPNGVDNAFAEQVLYPLLPGADVGAAINSWITNGYGGFVIVVDHWNLQPDDPQVGFRIVPAAGIAGGLQPTFAPNERWVVYADGWDPASPIPSASQSNIVTSSAYVAGGNLVADLRSAGGVYLWFGAGSQARALLQPAAVEVFGQILPPSGDPSKGGLPATIDQLGVAGVLLDPERDVDPHGLPQVVAASAPDAGNAGCLPQDYCPQTATIAGLLAQGRDMPSTLKPASPTACDSMSFGVRFYATQIAGVDLSSGQLASCPFSCADAGAALPDGGDAAPE